MVAAEATPAHYPGKRAFDDPSPGQRLKPRGEQLLPLRLLADRNEQAACGSFETAHDVHGPPQVEFEPQDQLAAIVAIAPEQLDRGKALLQWLKQVLGSG